MHADLRNYVVGNRGQKWPVPAGGSDTSTVPPVPGIDPASGFPDARTQTQSAAPATPEPPAEPHPSAAQPRDDKGRFTAEQIAQARKEEKDKLYPELEKMRQEVAELRAAEDARRAEAEKAREEAEAAEEAKRLAELSAVERVQEVEKNFQAQLQKMQEDREAEKRLVEMERQFSQLQQYAAAKVAEAGDDLLPELRDLVTGTTQEEIDASLAVLVERSSAIVEGAQQAMAGARAALPGVSITGAPPVGPVEENDSNYKTYSLDDLKGMDMATFIKNRGTLLGAASAQQNKGLFG